jgi:curved DNA-binding protein CbpA
MRIDDCYRLLDLKPGASVEDARQAHRDLTKVWHPDRFGHDAALRRKAEEKLKEINEAWKTIRDSAERTARAAVRDEDDKPVWRVRARGREYRFAHVDDIARLARRGDLRADAQIFDAATDRWVAIGTLPDVRSALVLARTRRLRTWGLMSAGLALLIVFRRPTLGGLIIALVLAVVALVMLTRPEPAE